MMNPFKPKFVWEESYSIGVPALDEQHQRLFDLLQKMLDLDAMDPAHALKHLPDILKQLNEYAAYHLLFEETLMKQHLEQDAYVLAHLTEHRAYWQRIAEFEQRIADGDIHAVHGVTVFLDYWWTHHIQKADRELGIRLNRNVPSHT